MGEGVQLEKHYVIPKTLLKSHLGAEKKFPELKFHAQLHQHLQQLLNLNVLWFAEKVSKPSPATILSVIQLQQSPKFHASVNGENSFKQPLLNGRVVLLLAAAVVKPDTQVLSVN